MYKAIGGYGAFNKYQMNLGENEDIKILVKNVVDRLNSIIPKEKILIYVYKENELVGRIVDNRDIYYNNNCISMVYLTNKQFKEWQKSRKKQAGIKL